MAVNKKDMYENPGTTRINGDKYSQKFSIKFPSFVIYIVWSSYASFVVSWSDAIFAIFYSAQTRVFFCYKVFSTYGNFLNSVMAITLKLNVLFLTTYFRLPTSVLWKRKRLLRKLRLLLWTSYHQTLLQLDSTKANSRIR